MSLHLPDNKNEDSKKDDFYDNPNNVVRKLGKKKIIVIARDFNVHIENNPGDYEDQQGS